MGELYLVYEIQNTDAFVLVKVCNNYFPDIFLWVYIVFIQE